MMKASRLLRAIRRQRSPAGSARNVGNGAPIAGPQHRRRYRSRAVTSHSRRSIDGALRWFAPAIAILLAGCAVGPDYKRPATNVPSTYRSQEPGTQPSMASLADEPWWSVFHDPALQQLIRTAIANNYDLRIAIARVEQSRAIALQATSQFFPRVGYDLEAAEGRHSFLGEPRPSLEVDVPGVGTVGEKNQQSSFLAALSATWEVDLWGRIRRLNEAARQQLLATEEARRGVTLSLVSSVAQAYFELLALDQQLQIAQDATASFRQSLDLFERRFQAGAGSKLEVVRAQASLASASAMIPEIERQILLKENQISVLLGENPHGISRSATMLEEVLPPNVPAGLPSELLERRPDVLQAEANLHAASAQIGVAVAEFFPKIGLTALYGSVSDDLASLASGDSVAWSLGVNLTGPIFAGGQLYGNYQQSKAAFEQAKLNYERQLLTAFREVADALASRQKLASVRTEQQKAVNAHSTSVDLSLERYRAGKSTYFEVLDNQQQLFQARNDLSQVELNQLKAFVQLYKSLGGGWQTEATTQPTMRQRR
jgi:multidrug efflux system outer membrane protein